MQNFSDSPRLLCFGVLALIVAWAASMACAAGPAFHVPAGQRQLFLDGYGIGEIEHLERTMHTPAKKGAVIRPDYRTGVSSYQTRSAPMWDRDAKLFRFWINGHPNDMATGACSYFESKDGLHWTKPNLGQVEYRGSRENNYVSVDVQGKTIGFECAAYDPTDPDPTRRFKGICRRPGLIGFMYQLASDGVTWRSVGQRFPIRKGDEDNFSFDPVEHLFIATLRHNGGPYGRAVDLVTSKDFKNWKAHGLMFHADELDQELGRKNMEARLADTSLHRPLGINPAKCTVDVYNMGVSRYEGLYVGFPAMFHRTGNRGFHLVQLTCSRDLKTWKRLGDRKTFIGPSKLGSGAYDLTQIIGPSGPVVRGDELWFYYTGLKYRSRPKNADPDTGAICLAVLRRDGFISLDAGKKQGTIVTKPFEAPGGKLFVNVDAIEGELRVEVMDRDGKVLAGSAPLKGDHARAEVQWQGGKTADFKDKEVTLRFTLRNSSLYSYWLQ